MDGNISWLDCRYLDRPLYHFMLFEVYRLYQVRNLGFLRPFLYGCLQPVGGKSGNLRQFIFLIKIFKLLQNISYSTVEMLSMFLLMQTSQGSIFQVS